MRWALVLLAACASSRPDAPRPAAAPPHAARPSPCTTTPCAIDRCQQRDVTGCLAAEARLATSFDPADREAGVTMLDHACQLGHAAACLRFATALDTGAFVPPDRVRAAAIGKRLCDANDAAACAWIAARSSLPEPERDKLLAHACELGHAPSCAAWASDQFTPEGDALRARMFAADVERCTRGDTPACVAARNLEHRITAKVPRDVWAAALDRERERCRRRIADGCALAVGIVEDGLTGPPDPAAAHRLAVQACDLGAASGCRHVLRRLERQQDRAGVSRLHHRLCDLGDDGACWYLAAYSTNPVEKRAMYLRACQLGSTSSCESAAIMLEDGTGGFVDPGGARALRDRSCRAGHANACLALGRHADKAGDRATAIRYLVRSCGLGAITHGCTDAAMLLHRSCVGTTPCEALDALLASLRPALRDAIAVTCCRDRPGVGESPAGVLVAFARAVRAREAAAVRSFIDPKRGLRVTFTSERDIVDELAFTVHRKTLSLARLGNVAQFALETLDCTDRFVDGVASCRAWGGGFAASYELRRDGARAYVLAIDEATH